jgi:hypothetical protein
LIANSSVLTSEKELFRKNFNPERTFDRTSRSGTAIDELGFETGCKVIS